MECAIGNLSSFLLRRSKPSLGCNEKQTGEEFMAGGTYNNHPNSVEPPMNKFRRIMTPRFPCLPTSNINSSSPSFSQFTSVPTQHCLVTRVSSHKIHRRLLWTYANHGLFLTTRRILILVVFRLQSMHRPLQLGVCSCERTMSDVVADTRCGLWTVVRNQSQELHPLEGGASDKRQMFG